MGDIFITIPATPDDGKSQRRRRSVNALQVGGRGAGRIRPGRTLYL